MRYRRLGKTGLQVSEIGFGGEWLERHPEAEGIELIHHAAAQGINILDCWMADPTSRDIIGKGIRDNRSHCISRAISAPPGRTVNISEAETYNTCARRSKTFCSACRRTTSISA